MAYRPCCPRRWLPTADSVLLAVGLLVGRITTLALDDPNSIGSPLDMLVIRSGVEFWPGMAAAARVAAWQARRQGGSPIE